MRKEHLQMPVVRELAEHDFTTTRWSGGTTTELLLLPPDGDYCSRRFSCRLSTAVVETEESLFTLLPGVRRWITPLERPLVLWHEAGPEIHLDPYDIYAFDGGRETHSRGTGRDFNLMLQGEAKGSMVVLRRGEELQLTADAASLAWAFSAGVDSRLQIDQTVHVVRRMHLLVMDLAAGSDVLLAAEPDNEAPLLCGIVMTDG
jgi:environmental stress-induced protein Ves